MGLVMIDDLYNRLDSIEQELRTMSNDQLLYNRGSLVERLLNCKNMLRRNNDYSVNMNNQEEL